MLFHRRPGLVAVGWAVIAVLASLVWGQCPGQWMPGTSIPDVDGPIYAMLAAPNGDLIVAGRFDVAGGVLASGVARWDGHAWSAFGQGVGRTGYYTVYALALLPNGDLIAAGSFGTALFLTVMRMGRFATSMRFPKLQGDSGLSRAGGDFGFDRDSAGIFSLPVVVNRLRCSV